MSELPRDLPPIDAELDSVNPYCSIDEAGSSPPVRKSLPGGLTTVCIIAAVLGGFGLLGAVQGAAGLAMNSVVQNTLQSQLEEGTGDAMTDSTLRMQLEISEVSKDYLWFHLLSIVALVVLGPALLIGAIMTLKRKAVGRKLLIAAMLVAALFEVCRVVPATMMQLKVGDAMQNMMQQVGAQTASEAGSGRADVEQFTGVVGKVMAAFALVFGLGWAMIKLGFYLFGWRYLRKPQVAGLMTS